jgi:hypothetical protein
MIFLTGFFLGAAFAVAAFPILVLYFNWTHELDDDDNPAVDFEDAFGPKGDK